ncbi:YncE family protein [Candidatus Nitrosocosmicus sp. R]
MLVIPFSDIAKAFAQDGVIYSIPVGSSPVRVAYNLDNKNMYVSNQRSDTVSVIDHNNNVVDTVTMGMFHLEWATTLVTGIFMLQMQIQILFP